MVKQFVSEKACFQRDFQYFKNFSFIIIYKEKFSAKKIEVVKKIKKSMVKDAL